MDKLIRSPIRALQTALYNLLSAAFPTRRYFTTMPPLNETPPFAILGSGSHVTTADDATKTNPCLRVTYVVEVWDRGQSNQLVLTMMDEILRATQIDGSLDLSSESFDCFGSWVESIEYGAMLGDAGGIYQYGSLRMIFGVSDQA